VATATRSLIGVADFVLLTSKMVQNNKGSLESIYVDYGQYRSCSDEDNYDVSSWDSLKDRVFESYQHRYGGEGERRKHFLQLAVLRE
jgi:hypothetical protein